jgi:dihydrofolate reductase
MGTIVVSEFVSLDSVAEDPQKWSSSYWNDKTEKFKNDELAATEAMLLGRKTYEGFAEVWPGIKGDFADRFNSLPKFVASRSLQTVRWSGSELLANPIADSVAKAKRKIRGNIYVHGSLALSQELQQSGLIDEYHLLIYPVVLGKGPKLFGEQQKVTLELMSSETLGSGVLALKYRTK